VAVDSRCRPCRLRVSQLGVEDLPAEWSAAGSGEHQRVWRSADGACEVLRQLIAKRTRFRCCAWWPNATASSPACGPKQCAGSMRCWAVALGDGERGSLLD
jgi:hypothetical protein